MKIHHSRNFIHLKIRRRNGVESLTTLEEGEFKLAIDSCISHTSLKHNEICRIPYENSLGTGLRNCCNKYQSKTACMLLLGVFFLSCSSNKLSLCIRAWGTNFSFLSHKVRAKSKIYIVIYCDWGWPSLSFTFFLLISSFLAMHLL